MLLTKAESVAALKSGYVTTDRLRLVKRDDEVLLDYPKSKLPQVLLTSLLALTLLYFLIDYISKGHLVGLLLHIDIDVRHAGRCLHLVHDQGSPP